MEVANGATNGHIGLNGHAETIRTNGRVSILDEAKKLVDGDRAQSYGPAEESFDSIAKVWSVILKTRITPSKVALCMAALKIVREAHSPKRDNRTDAAGYLELLDRLDHDE